MGYHITFGAGVLLAVIGVLLLVNTRFRLSGRVAVATVVDIKESYDSEGNTWRPIFSYRTGDGKEYRYESYPESAKIEWRLGEQKKLVYDPEAPWNPTVLTFADTFRWTVFTFGLSAALLVIGGGNFIARRYLEHFIATHS